jgi:hypothetical protein
MNHLRFILITREVSSYHNFKILESSEGCRYGFSLGRVGKLVAYSGLGSSSYNKELFS